MVDAATSGADFADEFHAAVSRWCLELEQMSDSSALYDLRAITDVSLDLTSAHPSGVAQLHAGHPTPLGNLIREPSALAAARAKARRLQSDSHEFSLRYGLPTTQLAIATASWSENAPGDDALQRTVPVLLRPVSLRHKAPGDQEIVLGLEPSVEINPVLVATLRGLGCLIDSDALAAECFAGAGFNPNATLMRLRDLGQAVIPDFRLAESLVVGSFVRPGQVLVEDLVRNSDALRRHPVVRALAGDERMQAHLLEAELPPLEPADPAPWDERGIGDLEPSQHRALRAVANGTSLFVEAAATAPVAATIAAMIADAAASGKSVLYVPGHQHAAEAVVRHLANEGLVDLALGIRPMAGWPERAFASLIEAAGLTVAPPNVEELAARQSVLAERSAQLGAYVTCMHQVREPWQVSAYEALQSLALATSVRPTPHTTVRIAPTHCVDLTASRRDECTRILERLAELGEFDGAFDTPWQNLANAAVQDTRGLGQLVRQLSVDLIPRVRADIDEVCAETEVDEPRSVTAWGEMLTMFAGVRRALDYFLPEVYERPATDMIDALAPAVWRRDHGIETPASTRRLLRKQAKDLLRPGQAVADLHAALAEAEASRSEWQRWNPRTTWPKVPGRLLQITDTYTQLRDCLEQLERALGADPDGTTMSTMPLDQLQGRVDRLWDSRDGLDAMPERAMLMRELERSGLAGLVEDLRRRPPETGGSYADARNTPLLGAELELSWWLSVFESILAADPFLASCNGRSLAALLQEYEEYDKEHVESLPTLVGAAVSHWMHRALSEHPAEFQELVDAAGRGSSDVAGQWRRSPHLMAKLRPCWIVGPLQITRAVPGHVENHTPVDLVIVDAVQTTELAQMIPALMRGGQIVAFGSERRALGRGAASALSQVLPHIELRADSGRRDPSLSRFLIEFGGELLEPPLPLPRSEQLVSLRLVDGSGMPAGHSGTVETTEAEVEAVVEAVADHVRLRPTESLGIVATSRRHAERLRDALTTAAARNRDIRQALDEQSTEPLVVVDLVGLDGLVRDAIIFAVGFAKTPHGRLLHKFGVVDGPDGEALLLGALAAVRHRLTVIACFGVDELDPERLKSDGSRMLGAILEFAGQGHEVVAQTQDPADTLLADLAGRLQLRGLIVHPHYGLAAGEHLPLAVGHPAMPDELSVAVLTDGPDFVQERSNRVRTRLRERELHALGWDVHFAWSIAAFLDPAEQVDAIEKLVRRRLVAGGIDPMGIGMGMGAAERAAVADVEGTLADDDSALRPPPPPLRDPDLFSELDPPAPQVEPESVSASDGEAHSGIADLFELAELDEVEAAPPSPEDSASTEEKPARRPAPLPGGPVLPEGGAGESPSSWGERPDGDDWLLAERPPHWQE